MSKSDRPGNAAAALSLSVTLSPYRTPVPAIEPEHIRQGSCKSVTFLSNDLLNQVGIGKVVVVGAFVVPVVVGPTVVVTVVELVLDVG